MHKSLVAIFDRSLRPGLRRNSIFSAMQQLFSLLCVLLAYRFLAETEGIEVLGLWSLLTAGSMLGRAADVGGGGSLARYLAMPRTSKVTAEAAAYIHTVTLTTLVLMSVMALMFFLVGGVLLSSILEGPLRTTAEQLLPLALVNVLVLSPVATTLSSALDGLQRSDLRAIAIASSTVLFPVITWFLVPEIGPAGFGIAQTCQQLGAILVTWWLLTKKVMGMGFAPFRWRYPVFRVTTAFGVKLQVNSISALLTEPVAKFMLGNFAGLTVLGYYELALRLQTQLRGLLVAAAQPIMAATAQMTEKVEMQRIISESRLTYLKLGVVICVVVGASASPIYSYFVLGTIQPDVVLMTILLGSAYVVNAAAISSYFGAMGLGVVRWNVLGQLSAAIFVALLGWPLGEIFGTYGVVSALCLGIVAGAVITIVGNQAQIDGRASIKAMVLFSLSAFAVGCICGGTAIIIAIVTLY